MNRWDADKIRIIVASPRMPSLEDPSRPDFDVDTTRLPRLAVPAEDVGIAASLLEETSGSRRDKDQVIKACLLEMDFFKKMGVDEKVVASKDLCRRMASRDKSDWDKSRRIARCLMHRSRAVRMSRDRGKDLPTLTGQESGQK